MHWLALLFTLILIFPVTFPMAKNELQWSFMALMGVSGFVLFLILARIQANRPGNTSSLPVVSTATVPSVPSVGAPMAPSPIVSTLANAGVANPVLPEVPVPAAV